MEWRIEERTYTDARAPGRRQDKLMVTIVTNVQLKEGVDQEWDAVMGSRMTGAKKQPGWVGGQLLRSEEDAMRRMIIGTWTSRADWKRWHEDPRFAETRRQLDGLVSGPEEHWWHEVVLDVRKDGTRRAPAAAKDAGKRNSKRRSR
jgi:heme-degrading monooxygenase HmoA